jgi:hypothetical protein
LEAAFGAPAVAQTGSNHPIVVFETEKGSIEIEPESAPQVNRMRPAVQTLWRCSAMVRR